MNTLKHYRAGCFLPWASDGMISIYVGGPIFGICSLTFVLYLMLSSPSLQFLVNGYNSLITLFCFSHNFSIFYFLLPFQLSVLKFCLIITTCFSFHFPKSCSFVLIFLLSRINQAIQAYHYLINVLLITKLKTIFRIYHRALP